MKRLFSFGLYKEGLRQSKLCGLIFGAIMMLGAIFWPLTVIPSKDMRPFITDKVLVDGIMFGPVFIVMFCFFAPILCLTLFSFLNKRSSSDFYHSIPHRRESLFFSYSLSMLTWLVGVLAVSSFTSYLIFSSGRQYVSVNYQSVMVYLLSILAAVFLVLAVTLFAMSITGTGFSNIVTTLLVIFLPRIIMTAFVYLVVESSFIVPPEAFGIFGDMSFNIPFSFVASLFSMGSVGSLMQSIGGIIYTAVLGLVYFALAFVFFKIRKSETAGTSAPNKMIQTVIRVALSFTVCVVACIQIFWWITTKSSLSLVGLCVIYGIALIVYFSYELITTKRLQNIAKAIPGLGVLIVLNIAFVGGAVFARNVVLNKKIDYQKISYAVLEFEDNTNMGSQMPSYESLMASGVKLQSKELHKLLGESIVSAQERIKNGEHYLSYQVPVYGDSTSSSSQQKITLVMESGEKIQRVLMLQGSVNDKVTQALGKTPEYKDALMNLPESPSSLSLSYGSPLSNEKLKDLYETYRQEVKSLDFATWYKLSRNQLSDTDSNRMMEYFGVSGHYKLESYYSEYLITDEMPKTLIKLMDYRNSAFRPQFEGALERTIDLDMESGSGQIGITAYNMKDQSGQLYGTSQYYFYPTESGPYAYGEGEKLTEKMIEYLKEGVKNQEEPIDLNKPFYKVEISYYVYTGSMGSEKNITVYFQSEDSTPFFVSE